MDRCPSSAAYGFETHAPVDRLGGKCVTQLMGMHVADARPFGRGDYVSVDGAAIEGLAVVALHQPSR